MAYLSRHGRLVLLPPFPYPLTAPNKSYNRLVLSKRPALGNGDSIHA